MVRTARLGVATVGIAFYWGFCAQASDSLVQRQQDFELLNLSACQKPSLAAPPLPKSSYEKYNIQRRFLRLEAGRHCQIMDIWIARLGGSPSPGMRVIESQTFKLLRGQWVTTFTGLQYFPYAIRNRRSGEVFYVEAPLSADVNDDMAIRSLRMRVLTASDDGLDAIEYRSYKGEVGIVYQALAVLMAEQLHHELKINHLASVVAAEIAKQRIRLLLEAAWKTLPESQRVGVDTEGLPR